MTDAPRDFPNFTAADMPDRLTPEDARTNRFTEAALERHKREGMDMALRTRWVALAVIAAMLPFINPRIEVLYYEFLLLVLAINGWAFRRVGRVGMSRLELLILLFDLSITVVVIIVPNPFAATDWPAAIVYRFGNFHYMYVLLAAGTLAFSWRTILAIGNWTTALWMLGLTGIWWFSEPNLALTKATEDAFGSDPLLVELLDPNNLHLRFRVQEVVIFMIVAITLSFTVRRFNRLLLGNAALERERENLSRYFSPNVVDELSQNDEPLKQIRTHNVAVLFVDIVGFTAYSAERSPQEVIETLRGFHARMETEVFANGGTLDKYLGDGLMATFGTPFAGDQDATNALRCVQAMTRALAAWNIERANAGEMQIKGSFGLHYGPVVLGDIGAHRLEFAVIGNTVNIASRVEALTRRLECEIAITDALHLQVIAENSGAESEMAGFSRRAPQPIRGLEDPIVVWTC